MRKKFACESGVLSLEASIVLPIFLFLMLFMYSLLIVFEARNDIAHVVLSTANSLALEAYEGSELGESGNITQWIYEDFGNDDSEFTDHRKWYVTEENTGGSNSSESDGENAGGSSGGGFRDGAFGDGDGSNSSESGGEDAGGSSGGGFRGDAFGGGGGGSRVGDSLLTEAIKDRFLAYLTDGNIGQAERILKRYHISGGVNGLDFSGSYLDGDDLHVVISYTLEYEFNAFGLGTVKMSQSACSKLWKE